MPFHALRARVALSLALGAAGAAACVLAPSAAHATQMIMTVDDGVVVYSGPGRRYRPIAKLESKIDLKAADFVVTGVDGDYYRVIAPLDEKRKGLGYVRVDWGVRKKAPGASEDELQNYSEVALARRTLSTTVSALSGDRAMGNLGLVYYLSPGFYLKGWGGAFFDTSGSGQIAAVELGNDALIVGRVSGIVALATGAFFNPNPGRIFAGSAGTNALMQGLIGLRWNATSWSFGAGWTQTVIFNANNSLVMFGPIATVEASL